MYDIDLMQNSGHLSGYLINDDKSIHLITSGLKKLANPDVFYEKYDVGDEHGILLFAMGDGNHSLATAKSIWEKNKEKVGMDHPSRYALVEIENVHDEGLIFEPIHRVLFELSEPCLPALADYYGDSFHFQQLDSHEKMVEAVEKQTGRDHIFGIISANDCGIVTITKPHSNLPAGTVQPFLDHWLENGKAKEIDYVHGAETTIELGKKPGNMGFYLPAMSKNDLFKTVILDGALPRKTFSMGEAHEKRFYMEARKIV